MIERESPRRYGPSAIETIAIATVCVVLLCALTALLPGP